VEHVSHEVGISAATLERWRADALANGSGAGSPRWTAAARLQAVIVTAAMDEATRSVWCREQGLYLAELDAWKRDAIAGLGEPRAASALEARQDRRRVKELERELHRKDKALAETAALLVLSKRSSTKARTHDPPGRPPDPGARHRTSLRGRRPARSGLCSGRHRRPHAAVKVCGRVIGGGRMRIDLSHRTL
jgi:transposase